MSKEELPTYDEHEHGLDADIKDVPLSTTERNARYDRYAGIRRALADNLNDEAPTLAAMKDSRRVRDRACRPAALSC